MTAEERPFSDVLDAYEFQRKEKGAFEKDTQYRLIVEAARFWVIEHYLRTGRLPDKQTYYAYANGPNGFDWGNPPGPDGNGLDQARPLRGKRVVVTFEIKEH